MNLIENVTKFTHKSMPSWGVGICRKLEGKYITVEFENVGIKKFGKSSVNKNLIIIEDMITTSTVVSEGDQHLTPAIVNNQNGALIQFDGETGSISGKNVIESFEGNDSVIFNETYIIMGEHTKALKIHAMYDLTIMGDVTVKECVVNGSLTVIGNARITKLTCHKGFICKGNLYSEQIYVGGDMIVDSIVCDELICDGNVVIQTTVNIKQVAQIAKTIVAYEGIMGTGKFAAHNAIANEYFEFDGEYEGKILELEMDTTISEAIPQKPVLGGTIEEIIDLTNQKLIEAYGRCPLLEEDQLAEFLHTLGAVENKELKALPLVEPLFSKLTEISYQNRIESVEDYLIVFVAKEVLPDEIFTYESIDHIGKQFMPKARDEVEKLIFEPTSVKQFARVLSMAVNFEKDFSDDWEFLMDKIFESVGLKYSTVSSMIRRNKLKTVE